MEVGVTLGTGLSVRLNVVEEPKPGPNFAITLLLHTVVQTVKGTTLKLKSAIHRNAQLMEVGVITGTGLSARLIVVEEPKPDTKNATTLLLHTVVQTVWGMTLKLK